MPLYFAFVRLALFLGSLFSKKVKTYTEVRSNQAQQLNNQEPIKGNNILFHCASLGEFEMVKPLIHQLKSQYPHKIFVSFFSPSGYNNVKQNASVDGVFYLPTDLPSKLSPFLKQLNITQIALVKYEIWFGLLHTAQHLGIKTCMVNLLIKDQHFLHQFWAKGIRKKLKYIDHFFVQRVKEGQTLKSWGFNNFTVTGDLRFDRLQELQNEAKNHPVIKQSSLNEPTIIAGSCWPPEEEMLFHWLQKNPTHHIILAPHNIHETHLKEVTERFDPFNPVKLSQWKTNTPQPQVLIVDSIGLLSRLYQQAHIAIVGGAFGKGLHNILEPTAFHLPVMFGPHTEKFPEADLLIKNGTGFKFTKQEQFDKTLNKLVDDKVLRDKIALKQQQIINDNIGSTEKVKTWFLG